MEHWPDYLASAAATLEGLAVTARDDAPMPVSDGFRRWVDLTREAHNGGRHLYLIGNGGSAMMASHFAADACKNAGLIATAFNDAALLTATGNDVAFDEIFALPLRRCARAGDLLIAISSSGNSPNIGRALDAARSTDMAIVTVTGKDAHNQARTRGDLNFYVPANRYGWVECAHQLILHYWIDQYLNLYGNGAV